MKKRGILLLMLCCLLMLMLTLGQAQAEATPVLRNGALAAYLDGNGHLYIPGNAKALNTASADGLVAIDAYRVLFLSDQADGTADLYMIDLATMKESLLVKDVAAACATDDGVLYYVTSTKRTALMRKTLPSGKAAKAFTAPEAIDRMYISAGGLVFEMVDRAGSMIEAPEYGDFVAYAGGVPAQSALDEAREIYLTRDDNLYIKNTSDATVDQIDSNVWAFAELDGKVYYLAHTGSAVRLKCYDPTAMTWQVLLTPEDGVSDQLTATDSALFLLGDDSQIYRVDTEKNELVPFRSFKDLSRYTLIQGYEVVNLRLSGMSGRLNVYAAIEEASVQPNFSFIEFTSTSDSAEPEYRLLESITIAGESQAWDALKPAVQYQPLYRGSRGDAVRAIQKPLRELDYYDYYVDGIFGPRTQFAVKLLQSDLGLPVTGVADSELQRMILNGEIKKYDPYKPLTQGNRGLRVQMMQEKLRDLGYMADNADGVFGGNTQRAVRLFQSENGLKDSNSATRETLTRLYSGRAVRCESYIDLYPGNTGCRVLELNQRLKALYYLEVNAGSEYGATTTEAVRAFQREAGLAVTGNATTAVLRKLFASDAPEASGYIVLRRGDDNSRVAAMQRRLRKLGYYEGSVDGYFGNATQRAVELFQSKVGLNVTGVATVRTQQLLFRDDAPVYVRPTVIGRPQISVDYYDHRDEQLYHIADDSSPNGYVTFSWSTEGEVKSFNVEIRDDLGTVLVRQDTLLVRTGVSIATLEYGRLYTLTVKAFPEDGNTAHITSASIQFERIETYIEPYPQPVIGEVDDPAITIETLAYTENGVRYVEEGAITFHWHADGEVQNYYIEIRNAAGSVMRSATTTDEEATIASDMLAEDQIYTLYVHVIPTNGTMEDGTVGFERFALADDNVHMEPQEPEEEEEEEEVQTEVVEETEEEEVQTEVVEETEEEEVQTEAVEETEEEEVQTEAVEETEVEEVQPEAVEETEEEEIQTEAVEETEEEEVQPEVVEETEEITSEPPIAVAAPVIDFETVLAYEDDVAILANDTIVMRWYAEGDVESYYIEVLDSDGLVQAYVTTTDTSRALDPGNLLPGEVYSLNVTAIPQGGTVEDGESASARFGLYEEASVEETVDPVVETEDVEAPYAEEEYSIQEETFDEDESVLVEDEPTFDEEYAVEDEPVYVDESYGEDETVYVDESYGEEETVYVDESDTEDEADMGEAGGEPVEDIPETAADEEIGLPVSAIQARLVELEFLMEGAYEAGVLDEATLAAINAFEAEYNASHGTELQSTEMRIDPETQRLLLLTEE